jgi:hypothetical protein
VSVAGFQLSVGGCRFLVVSCRLPVASLDNEAMGMGLEAGGKEKE